jgi:hypothetical protein
VRLDRVLGDEELLGDFAVAQALGDQLEDLELPRRDPQLADAPRVRRERLRGNGARRGRLRIGGFSLSERTPQPDARPGRKESDETGINLDRVLDDEEPVFGQLEKKDERAERGAVEQDVSGRSRSDLQRRSSILEPDRGDESAAAVSRTTKRM